jgi:cytochrome oxidase Cu insertion factor (SCO1/SenC/PrrC family)
MASGESPRRRGVATLALILLVCVIPFVASYLVYYLWPPQSRMNYGTLIDPRPFPATPLERLDGPRFSITELRGRWVMLQVDFSGCSEPCRRKLYQMRQVRLTQGREMGRIERVWLVRDDGPVEPALLREYGGTHIARAGSAMLTALPAEHDVADHVYLIDPLGNLMLRFPKDADPTPMKKDLDRLLKVSQVRAGALPSPSYKR